MNLNANFFIFMLFLTIIWFFLTHLFHFFIGLLFLRILFCLDRNIFGFTIVFLLVHLFDLVSFLHFQLSLVEKIHNHWLSFFVLLFHDFSLESFLLKLFKSFSWLWHSLASTWSNLSDLDLIFSMFLFNWFFLRLNLDFW